MSEQDLIALTVDVVTAHVSNTTIANNDIAPLIAQVHAALIKLKEPSEPEQAAKEPQEPSVPIRKSIHPDYIICLEDGRKMKILKRYLMVNFNMTPDQYREKWNLPRDYPMVAPNYAQSRREMAHTLGLGRKRNVVDEPVPKKVGRPKKLLGVAKPKVTVEGEGTF